MQKPLPVRFAAKSERSPAARTGPGREQGLPALPALSTAAGLLAIYLLPVKGEVNFAHDTKK
jgi:hypothetical protein